VGRIGRLVVALVLGVGIVGWVSPLSPVPNEIGSAPTAQNSLALVGTAEQDGVSLTLFGYVTHAAGLDDALLFGQGTDPFQERSEATARLTFFASATITSRAVHENLFTTLATGEVTFHFSEEPTGADFGEPRSFSEGEEVASFRATLQNVINVQRPNEAVETTTGEMTQTGADTFMLEGDRYRLGAGDNAYRVILTGQGTRTEPTIPRSTVVFAGTASLVSARGGGALAAGRERAHKKDGGGRVLAYIGIGLGAVALVVSLVALSTARRRTGS